MIDTIDTTVLDDIFFPEVRDRRDNSTVLFVVAGRTLSDYISAILLHMHSLVRVSAALHVLFEVWESWLGG